MKKTEEWLTKLVKHYQEDPDCPGCDLDKRPDEDGKMTVDISKMDSIDYMLAINELADKIHENARVKGFYDQAVSFPQAIALIHSEASEALEAHRNSQPVSDIEEELADIIIRVLDTARYHGFNIGQSILKKMEKNTRREKKHGKRY